jgi:alpha-L-glutamate ligase-like protein
MILRAFRELGERGVLGMNRRNAQYVLGNNPRKAYPSVDDKVLTKRLAERHGIPTPQTFLVLRRHGELSDLEKGLRDVHEFVVKPARGAGGSGILLVVGRSERGFVKASGETLSLEDLLYHISGILSGIHSLEGREDKAVVEALIHPDPVFAAVTYRGVPDVRVVVYRGVPTMAMVRLPTRASDGKANLHRGAIGAGIRLENGLTLPAVHRSSIVTHHPDTGNPVSGISVPHWRETLLMAARASDMTGLGYLGADVVMDRELGPLLLELNARPGLAIQLANRAGLTGRLDRIDRARSEMRETPEERVIWAMEELEGGAF